MGMPITILMQDLCLILIKFMWSDVIAQEMEFHGFDMETGQKLSNV